MLGLLLARDQESQWKPHDCQGFSLCDSFMGAKCSEHGWLRGGTLQIVAERERSG